MLEEFSIFCGQESILHILGYLVVFNKNPIVRNNEVHQLAIHTINTADGLIFKTLENLYRGNVPHNIQVKQQKEV